MEEGAINKPQEELEEIVSQEPSSREDIENETIRKKKMEEGAINKPQEELEEIVSQEPSSREDIENETIRKKKMEEGAINKPQEELEEIVSEEPSSREDIENETIRIKKMEEGAINKPQEDLEEEEIASDEPSSSEDEEEIVSEEPSSSKDPEDETEEIASEEPSSSKDPEDETIKRERALDENLAMKGAPLLQAVMKGDWPSAEAFLHKNKDFVRLPIAIGKRTALHIAASTKRASFVEELLKWMTPKDLELKNTWGMTALHFAAQTGVVRIAKVMVETNSELSLIPDNEGMTPLDGAAFRGDRNMVDYLFLDSVTPLWRLTPDQRIQLLRRTISAGLYDIALEILKLDKNLALTDHKEGGWKALKLLARKPGAIGSESQLPFWKKSLNSWHKGIYNNALMRTYAHQLVEELWKIVNRVPKKRFSRSSNPFNLLTEAAKVGNVEFIIILIRSNPDLLWQVNEANMSIFHFAILYRQESVFNLIDGLDEVGVMKENFTSSINWEYGDNMLHFAAKLSPSGPSIAALRMQQDLLWFKKIEKIIPPSYRNRKNKNDKTPTEIFRNEHEGLQGHGEKWMKQTANNCILVATLVATVVFAAAFTVPGGIDQITGKPILLKHNWFTIFFISDAIALVSSSTSILVFLSILTSSYGDDDFFKSIPLRLLFGLAALFVSIAGMVIAFSATCFLVYYSKAAWAPIVIIVLATIPLTLFVLAHFQLWVDTVRSTYWSKFLFRLHKRKIF